MEPLVDIPPIVAATAAGNCDAVHLMVTSSHTIPEEDLNQALEMAVSHGQKHILQLLIDAGAQNLERTMYTAGRDGETRIIDMLLLLKQPVEICFAFMGAMDDLRSDMVAYLVRVGNVKGLEKCLVMASCSLWGCRSLEELDFLQRAMESLVAKGASNFEETIYRACSKTAIEQWNCNHFDAKAQLFERLFLWGAHHLTPGFHSTLLLTICVTFFERLESWPQPHPRRLPELERKLGNLNQVCSGVDVETTVHNMVNLLAIVCRNGLPGHVSKQLLDFANLSFRDRTSLLQVTEEHMPGPSAPGTSSRGEWPLKMIRYLLVDCHIAKSGPSVTLLPLMVAASLDVMLPVVRLLTECDPYDASLSYFRVAVSYSQGEAIQYLLDTSLKLTDCDEMIPVVRHATCSNRVSSPEGVLYLFHVDYLKDPKATLTEAEHLAEWEGTNPIIRSLLQEHWSPQAFADGIEAGQKHFWQWMLAKKRGTSPLCLEKLPLELQVAIGFLALYRECSRAPGSLLSQRQQGELLAVVHLLRDYKKVPDDILFADKPRLLSLLASCLPVWSRDVTESDRDSTLAKFFSNQKIYFRAF